MALARSKAAEEPREEVELGCEGLCCDPLRLPVTLALDPSFSCLMISLIVGDDCRMLRVNESPDRLEYAEDAGDRILDEPRGPCRLVRSLWPEREPGDFGGFAPCFLVASFCLLPFSGELVSEKWKISELLSDFVDSSASSQTESKNKSSGSSVFFSSTG